MMNFKILFKSLAGTLLLITLFSCNNSSKNNQIKENNESQENNDSNNSRIWASPAGKATIPYSTVSPFLTIYDDINISALQSVSQGRELFIAEWNAAPGSRVTLDGLGPLFNAKACSSCHVSDGRIDPFNETGTLHESFLFRIGDNDGNAHSIFGPQLQSQGTTELSEGNVTWSISNNELKFTDSAGLLEEGYNLGPRIAPHILGMGLLDLIEEETIVAFADENDSNNDGISGRVHWVMEKEKLRVGRFGWKAINSSLITQNAGALHQDMGLTTSVNPNENCTDAQEICDTEANGGTPEVSDESLNAISSFMTALGVPDRRIENQEEFDKGADVFDTIGCALCHRPTMKTGKSDKFKGLAHQTLYAYTDLLLHDMGEKLSDGVVENNASGSEWRTPPLWSIGIVEGKDGASFLHDGRAKSIEEAIVSHGGEAETVKGNYLDLSKEDKEDLFVFLRSI